ncbi:hypothetical protein RRG08_063914 [Elysia crispata]|uniref:Uncharacterized protein n=1 Tax=Elysia crispata TaxID=231223 RepID=A0AAE0YFJ5_9GAST|nr:hypothetical protein RRG08_063914 [Elysia crispata]
MAQAKKITITYKFLVKGHSQTEVESVYHTIGENKNGINRSTALSITSEGYADARRNTRQHQLQIGDAALVNNLSRTSYQLPTSQHLRQSYNGEHDDSRQWTPFT